MLRMFARMKSQMDTAAGNDDVLFGLSLPSDTVIHDIRAQVHVIGQTVLSMAEAIMYGIQGYILPVLDPDAAASFNQLWDTLVPKDDDTDTIDLDTGAADAQSMYEPGESSMAEVMDLGLQPERIYHYEKLLSFANSGFRQEDTSVLEWAASDVVDIRIRKRFRVHQPSVVLFALGNADLTDTTATEPAAAAENEWPRLKYMTSTLEMALMQHFGLIETGAETPFEDAAKLLRKHLEPDLHEEAAGSWGSKTLKHWSAAIIDHSVSGEMAGMTLSTGG